MGYTTLLLYTAGYVAGACFKDETCMLAANQDDSRASQLSEASTSELDL